MKKTKEQIIYDMCLTYRHDYGMDKGEFSGMTENERLALYRDMEQIYYHHIAELKKGYDRYEKVRRLNAHQFSELRIKNIKECVGFDNLIDELE